MNNTVRSNTLNQLLVPKPSSIFDVKIIKFISLMYHFFKNICLMSGSLNFVD